MTAVEKNRPTDLLTNHSNSNDRQNRQFRSLPVVGDPFGNIRRECSVPGTPFYRNKGPQQRNSGVCVNSPAMRTPCPLGAPLEARHHGEHAAFYSVAVLTF